MPFEIVGNVVGIKNLVHSCFQRLMIPDGRIAEVKTGCQYRRRNVWSANAALNINNLEAGGWKKVIALIPLDGVKFRENRSKPPNRVIGKLWVSDMALHAINGQQAT